MKTITLQEAYQQATKGPLYATNVHVQSASLNEDNYVCEAEGDTPAQAKHNAALLAHCFNHMEEMIEVLNDCVESLSRLPDIDGAFRTTCLQQARTVLTKASTVTLPD